MYKRIFAFLCLISISFSCYSWGFFGHKKIGYLAIFTLPSPLSKFYKKHHKALSNKAPNADKRRFNDPKEAPRHYIDIDHYGSHPFELMPERWKDALAKYSQDTLTKYGVVPWHIHLTYMSLVKAFKEKDEEDIIRISADLGHYIADAHVPLHTTENHNGQLTGQQGIHALWESRLPEMFSQDYNFYVGKAHYIEYPLKEAWKAIKDSHKALDSVLRFEKELQREFPIAQKEGFVRKGTRIIKTYSDEYATEYHKQLSGMVERRMRAAIYFVGCYWYSAWVDAGQPILDNTTENKPISIPEENSYAEGKMLGGRTEDE